MNIDSIINGIVLDHITAGRAMEIYRYLGLDALDCPVAIIQKATSRNMGKKDIIKIDGKLDIDLNVLGFIDPGITINTIVDGKLVSKHHPELPEILTGILECHNPRCITSTEQELPQVFRLADRKNHSYRCIYCETQAK